MNLSKTIPFVVAEKDGPEANGKRDTSQASSGTLIPPAAEVPKHQQRPSLISLFTSVGIQPISHTSSSVQIDSRSATNHDIAAPGDTATTAVAVAVAAAADKATHSAVASHRSHTPTKASRAAGPPVAPSFSSSALLLMDAHSVDGLTTAGGGVGGSASIGATAGGGGSLASIATMTTVVRGQPYDGSAASVRSNAGSLPPPLLAASATQLAQHASSSPSLQQRSGGGGGLAGHHHGQQQWSASTRAQQPRLRFVSSVEFRNSSGETSTTPLSPESPVDDSSGADGPSGGGGGGSGQRPSRLQRSKAQSRKTFRLRRGRQNHVDTGGHSTEEETIGGTPMTLSPCTTVNSASTVAAQFGAQSTAPSGRPLQPPNALPPNLSDVSWDSVSQTSSTSGYRDNYSFQTSLMSPDGSLAGTGSPGGGCGGGGGGATSSTATTTTAASLVRSSSQHSMVMLYEAQDEDTLI